MFPQHGRHVFVQMQKGSNAVGLQGITRASSPQSEIWRKQTEYNQLLIKFLKGWALNVQLASSRHPHKLLKTATNPQRNFKNAQEIHLTCHRTGRKSVGKPETENKNIIPEPCAMKTTSHYKPFDKRANFVNMSCLIASPSEIIFFRSTDFFLIFQVFF